MYPLAFDLTKIRILLVGTGDVLARRARQLAQQGATKVTLFEDRLPEAQEIRQTQLLMVAGLDEETSAVLSSIARLQGVIVNVEDKPDLSDFYFMSYVARGDLILAVSTNGASPTLSQEIKNYLGTLFGEEWQDIVARLGQQRQEWKRAGLDNKAVGDRTRLFIAQYTTLPVSALPSDHHAGVLEPV